MVLSGVVYMLYYTTTQHKRAWRYYITQPNKHKGGVTTQPKSRRGLEKTRILVFFVLCVIMWWFRSWSLWALFVFVLHCKTYFFYFLYVFCFFLFCFFLFFFVFFVFFCVFWCFLILFLIFVLQVLNWCFWCFLVLFWYFF